MKEKLRIYTFLFFLISCSMASAQQSQRFSGNYENSYFIGMIDDLESRYNISFYYKTDLDSIKINLAFKDIYIDSLVSQISNLTNQNFLVRENAIISTEDYAVDPNLNKLFFEKQTTNNTTDAKSEKSILDNIKEINIQDQEEQLQNVLIEIGDPVKRFDGQTATLSGFVRESKTGEPVIGASVFRKVPQMEGVITDQFGYYAFTLPKGKHEIFINSTGMKTVKRQVMIYSDGDLTIELKDDIVSLKEIVVTGEKNTIENLQTGFANLNIKNIKQIPSIMGEADIMKIALTLPGVQTVGEGAAGFNVRGGSADQNLVLINDVPIYNTNHLFGFFSVFNPDVIASANLYKSGIGANYGGRIASVFDVALRDGNKKDFSLKGGISPLTTKLTAEGPIKKDTSSYIVGLRTTYSDWILSLIDDPTFKNSTGSFSDAVAKVTHEVDEKNKLILSAYHSRDRFKLNFDSLYRYFNSNASLQLRHTFSSRLLNLTSVSFANYNYQLSSDANPTRAFDIKYNINHYQVKSEFNYFPKEKVNVKFGISSILYDLQPGRKDPLDQNSLVEPVQLVKEKGIESAIYGSYEFDINNRLSASAGLRLSMFNALGPGRSFTYQPNSPRETQFILDTTFIANNELIKTYVGPELRLASRYKLRDDLSFKFSYDRMYQYIHVLSNTTAISPTDVWRLSGENIKPQIGNQISAGVYKTIYGTSLELSLEGYFKTTNNLLEYKDGAELLLNEALETDIISAKGKSYGIEFLLKKKSGKFSGWLSYTYSRSKIKAAGQFSSEIINSGEYFPSTFDKPHSLVLVSNFKINRRVNISLNSNYSSGRPTTVPVIQYEFKNQPLLLYTDRNQFRIPYYFRTDLAFNFEGNHKVHKKVHGSWSFSIYNLTSRANAYSVFFRSENDQIDGFKLSVFKNAIPTITYHFEFR